jgi:fucose permease
MIFILARHYDIGYSIVSLIFITNAVGFILAAFMVDLLRAKLGRARTLFLGNILIMFGYVPIIFAPPFPVVVCCFLPLGLGMAINVALGNVFAANLQNGTTMLGAMHGSYGIGGTLGPLISTAMVTTGGMLWSRYYILTLSVAAFNGLFALWSFWNYEREAASSNLLTNLELTASRAENSSPPSASPSRVPLKKAQFSGMANALKTRTVLLGAVFIFAYQGAEVTISGWVISFLITARGGDPSSVGYVTAGFWLGITIGRFCISPLAHKIGEKLFVYGAIVGAAVFELLVWFVPNIIGDAVAVCIVGLLLGPIFPCAMVVYSRLIRRQDQVSSLSVISAFGSSGGAVAPFTTGILAQAAGTFVLHPIAIGLFAVMITCWLFLPKADKRSE